MKKLVGLFLVLTMALSLTVTAFAADETMTNVGSKDITVQATVTDGSDGANNTVHTYRINITWTATDGAYRLGGSSGTTYTWDGVNKTYKTSTGADGQGAATTTTPSVSVTVTNYSDLDVKAKAEYTANAGNGSTWGNTTGETLLKTAVTGDPSTDGKTDYTDKSLVWGTVTFAGDVTYTAKAADAGSTITLGTVKVTITAA